MLIIEKKKCFFFDIIKTTFCQHLFHKLININDMVYNRIVFELTAVKKLKS